MTAPKKPKRFIAGAVCPRCEAMDTIRVYQEDDKDFRECVKCGFSDRLHFQPQVRELDTRVNRSEEELANSVQILDLQPLKKDTE